MKPCKKTIKNANRTTTATASGSAAVKGSQHGSRPKNQFKINVKCLDPQIAAEQNKEREKRKDRVYYQKRVIMHYNIIE